MMNLKGFGRKLPGLIEALSIGTIMRYCLSRMMEENHENLSHDSKYRGRDSNRTHPKYKYRVLPLVYPCSVVISLN
jgi:hypothetical protein